VWKLENFSATQILCETNYEFRVSNTIIFTNILREIKFGDSRSAKSAISTRLEAQNFDFYDFCTF